MNSITKLALIVAACFTVTSATMAQKPGEKDKSKHPSTMSGKRRHTPAHTTRKSTHSKSMHNKTMHSKSMHGKSMHNKTMHGAGSHGKTTHPMPKSKPKSDGGM